MISQERAGELQTHTVPPRYQLHHSGFRLETEALTKALLSVSRFQSAQGDASLPGLAVGTSRKLSSRTAPERTEQQEKHPKKRSDGRGDAPSTTCCYTVQHPSKRTASAVRIQRRTPCFTLEAEEHWRARCNRCGLTPVGSEEPNRILAAHDHLAPACRFLCKRMRAAQELFLVLETTRDHFCLVRLRALLLFCHPADTKQHLLLTTDLQKSARPSWPRPISTMRQGKKAD